MNILTGSKVAASGTSVVLSYNDDKVNTAASILGIKLIQRIPNGSSILSVEDATSCFAYALRVVLSSASGAQRVYESVPTFLCDLIHPIESKYRGVVVHVSELSAGKRPDSYGRFLDVLASLNLPIGKVLRIGVGEVGNVMTIGVEDVLGAETLMGTCSEINLEELVLRSLVKVDEEGESVLKRLLGHMDHMYVGVDEVIRMWFGAHSFT